MLDIKGAFSVVRGVTPAKLARAYNRLWESLDDQGDHRFLEGATQSTVSREMRDFEEELERLEDGPDDRASNVRLVSAVECFDDAQRVMRGLTGRTPVFRFEYGS